MECQNTINNLLINKNKTIGEVVVVVEGESEEFRLLKHIFTKVLNYNYITIKRGNNICNEFRSKNNINSTVIIVNTSSSNIKTIMEDSNYQDKLYGLLKSNYNRSLKNVPVYILWDRDNESNSKEVVLKSLTTFKNSMDNDYDMNGLLLLSYPCIESYALSNFDKQIYKKTIKCGKDAKKMLKRYSLKKITENNLLRAVGNMHRSMLSFEINSYDPSDFYKQNKKIFDCEENYFKETRSYIALSLLSIMLIDLGIIYQKNN